MQRVADSNALQRWGVEALGHGSWLSIHIICLERRRLARHDPGQTSALPTIATATSIVSPHSLLCVLYLKKKYVNIFKNDALIATDNRAAGLDPARL